ncbi:diguanylate cyclase [Magnetospirillum sp. SS-4]|uniref:GGDEF domain-containing protein n=1 Tax=Magnetospirillum sp. SS-4 TaxID=2681465 RepID=UPI001381516C|nr:GGDEF domain-containing protein [Magnetospirillum sp. SS-4]CAA7614334.1 Response regulator containing a CheY-like receiver domain and a GGDEF domain [Magnetospirillum sp. SS-4]
MQATTASALIAKVMDARLLDLLAEWRAAGGNIADPAAHFARHAPHLLVIEAEPAGNRYVHYGAAFTRHFGADLTGCVIDVLPADVLPAERRGMLEFEYAYARQVGRPLWRSYTAPFDGGRVETWQRLVLPVGGGWLAVGAYPTACGDRDDEATALLRLAIERVPVVLGEDGGVADLALSLRDFCDTRQHVAELEVLATRDSLTGIANRRHFHHLAGLELDHARRMGRSFALLALDIDHFKRVNDTFGHAAGDEALRAFVAACRLCLREYDILGRLGGEEFAVALPNTGRDGACVIAERLRHQVDEVVVRPSHGHQFGMTVSIGIACLDRGDVAQADVSALLDQADSALYRAKAMGRNRVEVADASQSASGMVD